MRELTPEESIARLATLPPPPTDGKVHQPSYRNRVNGPIASSCSGRNRSSETIARAKKFRTGALWAIERNLATLKAEIFGPRHREVTPAIRA